MLSPRDALTPLALVTMSIVASTLLPLKAEFGEGVAFCSPKRVMRQLVYDRGTVTASGNMENSAVLVAEPRFIGEGRNLILAGHDKLF